MYIYVYRYTLCVCVYSVDEVLGALGLGDQTEDAERIPEGDAYRVRLGLKKWPMLILF